MAALRQKRTFTMGGVLAISLISGLIENAAARGVRVLALSSDREGRAKVEPFYRDRGIRHLGLWLDPRGAAQRALGARGLPTTVIIDRQGRERARLEGAAEWDRPDLLAAIRRLVEPPPAALKQA